MEMCSTQILKNDESLSYWGEWGFVQSTEKRANVCEVNRSSDSQHYLAMRKARAIHSQAPAQAPRELWQIGDSRQGHDAELKPYRREEERVP